MRIAVIADLHANLPANLPALRAVLHDVAALDCDRIWCVGDVVGRGPHPGEVIEELRRLDAPTVQGNWDEAVALRREHPGVTWPTTEAEADGRASLAWTIERTSDERACLRQLPAAHRFAVEDRSVLLFHGSPLRQNEYLWHDRPSRVFARVGSDEGDDLLCFGNTHEAFHRVVGKSHFVAAGSVGCRTASDPNACYAVIDMAGSELMVTFRSVPYDHAAVDAVCAWPGCRRACSGCPRCLTLGRRLKHGALSKPRPSRPGARGRWPVRRPPDARIGPRRAPRQDHVRRRPVR